VNWHLTDPSVIAPAAGQYRVGSPGQWPDSASWVYFGTTPQQNSTGFQINFAQWDQPTS